MESAQNSQSIGPRAVGSTGLFHSTAPGLAARSSGQSSSDSSDCGGPDSFLAHRSVDNKTVDNVEQIKSQRPYSPYRSTVTSGASRASQPPPALSRAPNEPAFPSACSSLDYDYVTGTTASFSRLHARGHMPSASSSADVWAEEQHEEWTLQKSNNFWNFFQYWLTNPVSCLGLVSHLSLYAVDVRPHHCCFHIRAHRALFRLMLHTDVNVTGLSIRVAPVFAHARTTPISQVISQRIFELSCSHLFFLDSTN